VTIPQTTKRVQFYVYVENAAEFHIDVFGLHSNDSSVTYGPDLSQQVDTALENAMGALAASLEASYPTDDVLVRRTYVIVPDSEVIYPED
jgi:hypothetical protein